jgi:hypothetical protein
MARRTRVTRRDQRGNLPNPVVFGEAQSWRAELAAVNTELHRVLDKWGAQSLTLFDWASVLGEEHGEVCAAINRYEFGGRADSELRSVYLEAVQVAAVAVHLAAVVRESAGESALVP